MCIKNFVRKNRNFFPKEYNFFSERIEIFSERIENPKIFFLSRRIKQIVDFTEQPRQDLRSRILIAILIVAIHVVNFFHVYRHRRLHRSRKFTWH